MGVDGRELGHLGAGLWRYLPRGGALPDEVWNRRHAGIVALLWLHVPAVLAVAVVREVDPSHAAFETSIVVGLAWLAQASRAHRRLSTVVASVGLLTCSAILVHLADGLVEMHFHFFVMVAVVALYQDWRPFLVAIAYVVLQHGVAGAIAPEAVYNHPAAVANPWAWAGVHGFFILGMSLVGIVTWKLNEQLLDEASHRERRLAGAKEDLLETLSLLNATLDATVDGILVVDSEGRIVSFNSRFAEIWSIPDQLLQARDDAAAISFVLAQLVDPDAFEERIAELYARPAAESHDTLRFKDGRVVERSSKPQRLDSRIVGRVWTFRDVTEQARLADELTHQALHDSLTGLANQALFRDRVEHALALAARRGTRVAALFLDLDDFKTVNDSLGHTAGDDLLVAVSRRIQASLRASDTPARLGGDEFAVLIEEPPEGSDAGEAATRLLEALHDPFRIGGTEVVVSASIGIAFADPGTSTDQLLRNADLAMYTAKGRGRNLVEVFSPEMHVAAVERLTVESDLRRALARGELVLHYQPVVDLEDGRMVGVEALVRWQHPQRGLLLPRAFIDVAEASGLIGELGEQVLEAACAQGSAWHREHPDREPLRISVNLSIRQLHDRDVAQGVRAVLQRTGMVPAALTVEITESAMMHDPESALARLEELRVLGLDLAIDDFGTGYSSLSHLQRFPVDMIKIDRTFVHRIDEGPEESALARAIVRLARTLRLTSLAEGVETEAQAELLLRMGCRLAQGYLFSPPVPAEQISALLVAGTSFDVPVPASVPSGR